MLENAHNFWRCSANISACQNEMVNETLHEPDSCVMTLSTAPNPPSNLHMHSAKALRGYSHSDMDGKCANSVDHFLLSFVAQLKADFFLSVVIWEVLSRIDCLFSSYPTANESSCFSEPIIPPRVLSHVQGQHFLGCSTISNLIITMIETSLTPQAPEPAMSQLPWPTTHSVVLLVKQPFAMRHYQLTQHHMILQ